MFEKIKELFREYILKNNKSEKKIKDSKLFFGVPVKSVVEAEKNNPIQPYFPAFCKNHFEVGNILDKYKNEGRVFTASNYEDIFKSHISVKGFLNENKISYLHNMWQDALFIKNLLEPLKKIGLEYTLDLTGGSVRDRKSVV